MAYPIRPRVKIEYGRINQPVRIPIIDLIVNNPKTHLTADLASGSTSLTVKNTTDFDYQDIVLIGEVGNEGTEIISSVSSTTPYVSMTLSTATGHPHSAGTSILVVDYDYVEIASAPALTATKEAVSTPQIIGNNFEIVSTLSTPTTGYYFARFYNSLTGGYSDYSDGVPIAGYTQYMARSVIDNALRMINKENSDLFTNEYAFSEINNCQIEVIREMKRWSFMQEFDYRVGTVETGDWFIALPSDCDDQNSNKSIYNFRIGREKDLVWIDKEKWNSIIHNIAYSTISSPIVEGDIKIYVSDSSDFGDTGVVNVKGSPHTYTDNNRIDGILTISSATSTAESGDAIHQSGTEGNPSYWTIHGGYAYFYPFLGSSYNNRDAHMDYYKKMTEIVSDTTEIVLPDPTIVHYYLAWKFLLRQQGGAESDSSRAMYSQYAMRRDTLKKKESMNRTVKLKPTINRLNMNYGSESSREDRLGDLWSSI